MKMDHFGFMRPNYFILIGYFQMEDRELDSSEPSGPLWIRTLQCNMHYLTEKHLVFLKSKSNDTVPLLKNETPTSNSTK